MNNRPDVADQNPTAARDEDAAPVGDDRDRAVIALCQDCVYERSLDKTVQFITPACKELTGYTAEEFTADPGLLESLIHPDDRAAWDDHEHVVRSDGSRSWLEFRIVTKNGRTRWVSHTCEPVCDAAGRHVGQRGIHRDVTERKLVERALLHSENRFRAVAESMCDWEAWIDPTGRLLWINPAVEAMTGYTVEECLCMPQYPLPMAHEDDREMLASLFNDALAGTSGEDVTFRIRRKDGSVAWMAMSWRPIFSPDGRSLGHRTSIRDITRRKQRDEQADVERQQLLFIFDSIDEPVYISTPDTHELLYVNEAFKRYWGDGTGRKCYEVMQGAEGPCPFCTNDRIFGENIGWPYVWESQNKVTGRWFRCIDKAIRWPDGRMVRYEMALDITERQQVEEALREQQQLLQNVLSRIPHFVFWKDRESRYLGCNQNFARVAGVECLDQIVNKTDYDLPWRKEEAEAFIQNDREVMNSGVAQLDVEETQCQADGKQAILLTSRVPLRNASGNVIGILGIYADMTDRRQAEQKLRDYAAKLKAANLELEVQKQQLKAQQLDLLTQNEEMEKLTRELGEANARLSVLTRTDPLTGLLNRRAWQEGAQAEQERFARYGGAYGIVMVDVDYFKAYNDSQGHLAGDDCLRRIARCVQATCRSNDFVGRYGGEELIILCPQSDRKATVTLARRICEAVHALGIRHPAGNAENCVTVSAGAAASIPGDTWEATVKRADDALYAAKNAGRNRAHAEANGEFVPVGITDY